MADNSIASLVHAPDESLLISAAKYEVELPGGWKGPYDVLLDVIQERELNLFDLDIAILLDGYLAYMEAAETIDVDDAGEFLVVAATLAQIKSKMLLPREEQVADEEEKDPREDLVRYLMEYQRVKAAAEQLRERPLLGRDVFAKGYREHFDGVDGEGRGTLFQLVKGFQKVMKDLRAEIPIEFTHEEISVSDRLQEIFQVLKTEHRATFMDLIGDRRSKPYLIVTFLCLLELVRLKKMKIQAAADDAPLILEFMEGAENDLDHSEFDGPQVEHEGDVPPAELSAPLNSQTAAQ